MKYLSKIVTRFYLYSFDMTVLWKIAIERSHLSHTIKTKKKFNSFLSILFVWKSQLKNVCERFYLHTQKKLCFSFHLVCIDSSDFEKYSIAIKLIFFLFLASKNFILFLFIFYLMLIFYLIKKSKISREDGRVKV